MLKGHLNSRAFFSLLPLFVALFATLASGCSSRPVPYQRIEGNMLGTTALVVAQLPADSTSKIYQKLTYVDSLMKAQMSIYDSTSLLSKINRGEGDSLTLEMVENITLAGRVNRLSEGVYDITVLPLVRAWGFSGHDPEKSPNIDSLLEFVGYDKISIESGRLRRTDPRVQLDFNSIAKGYTVDMVARSLEAMGAENYLVDIGGELVCRGVNPRSTGWTIGVESPFDGNMTNGEYLQKRIVMEPQRGLSAMATSGNYRRFYLNDKGEKIAHTIDPRTGLSTPSKLLSATVIASSCALADAYATMFLALGSERAEAVADRIAKEEGIEVYFIYGEGESEADSYREYFSEGVRAMIQL